LSSLGGIISDSPGGYLALSLSSYLADNFSYSLVSNYFGFTKWVIILYSPDRSLFHVPQVGNFFTFYSCVSSDSPGGIPTVSLNSATLITTCSDSPGRRSNIF